MLVMLGDDVFVLLVLSNGQRLTMVTTTSCLRVFQAVLLWDEGDSGGFHLVYEGRLLDCHSRLPFEEIESPFASSLTMCDGVPPPPGELLAARRGWCKSFNSKTLVIADVCAQDGIETKLSKHPMALELEFRGGSPRGWSADDGAVMVHPR
ncbi:hypothetical protein Ae201684P_004565 [Aphanomyces euteiches]|nr:hypothetical protein Ae201684P_004565 [Aphanomyces euteiches]